MRIISEKSLVKVPELVLGSYYRFIGDIQNGSYVTHEDVVRKLVSITPSHLVLECGRRFIINENLVITEF